MRSSYSRFLYSFPLFVMVSSMPFNTGFALDNDIANMSLSKLQGINSGNAANTQDALGVDAHAVGDQSAMSGDSMGAVGKRFANMTLIMSPQCSSDSVLNGLDGAILKFPCQSIATAITGVICLPKLADCSDDKNFAPITVPVGSSKSIYGYDFSASCQANCTIRMAQNGAVITNADTINSQSKQEAAKNDQYNMVAQGYVGKDGYSQQQAYLWSFGKGGDNDVIGTQCINGAAGYLDSGEYHTCDNSQSGSFKTGCHEEKTCTDWKTTSRDIDTYHQCTLKAKVSDVQCDKVPVVTVQEVVI
ncbi:MAG: hypothetical protein O2809_00920, partial [Proteobacteria bacterium]|nr:hypothetical protein [Pseudomonadota bacterium]